jgi:hypothetical protein
MPRLIIFFTAYLLLVINCLVFSTAYGHTPSWDIDGDGKADALTDGILTLRYGFGIRGENLTSNALSQLSTMSILEIEDRLSDTLTIADIDGNGIFDALTDGLIILRYLFGITGDNLVENTIAFNATRNSSYEIIEYIEQHLPKFRLSNKRGMGYGTGGDQQEISIQDFEIIGERMSWFYDWSTSSPESVRGIYKSQSIDFTPMLWGRNSSENNMRQYLDNNPGVKYLLGFNEPTHLNQANLTPQEAAEAWPILEAIADDYNLKLVSPAVGNSSLYGAWEYLDAFFQACSNCRVDYVAVHKYGKDIEQFKEFITESFKYEKPIWVTEYAGNGGGGGANWPETSDVHLNYMAETTRWLESQDNVFRYAWFVGRNKEGIGNFPYNGLLGENGKTTALGETYFSIPSIDFTYQSGIKIPAVGANNLDGFTYNEVSDGDNITATTADTSANSFLEFDFNIKEAQDYALEVRVASPSIASLTLFKGQETFQEIQNISVVSTPNWQTIVSDPFELSLGKKTLRIEVDPTVAINSVKLVTPNNLSETVPAAGITVGESSAFIARDDTNWTHVIPLVDLSDGPSSQGEQILSLNITELPSDGAGYRVTRTNANGFWFSASRQELVLGNNNITVNGESFERNVRIQLSSPNIRFDSLSINGVQIFP